MHIKKINDVFFQVLNHNVHELDKYFKVKDSDCYFKPKFKMGMWDGFIHFYNTSSNMLPIGLSSYLKTFISDNELQCEYDFNSECNYYNIDEIKKFIEDNNLNSVINPYPFQLKSIQRALNYKRGIIKSPTGSGKSSIIYNIVRRLLSENKSILIITPQVDLVNQLFKDFESYGWKECCEFVNTLHGEVKKYKHDKPILISTYQSLLRLPSEYFESFDAVIVDEVHTAKAVSIRDILIQCVNAEYRIGLTATLPKKELDRFTIFAYLGKLIFDISIKTLIEDGFLTPLQINVLYLEYLESMRSNCKREFDDEYKIISKIPERNKLLYKIIEKVEPTENVLILCKNLNQVKDVYNFINSNIKQFNVHKIQGDVVSEERDNIIKIMENTGSNITVATYGTMSTGRNVKRLHHVVLFSPYKSDIKVIQSIGRGTRLHITKKILTVWDIVDVLKYYDFEGSGRNRHKVLKDNYLVEHSNLRLQYYKELEFPVQSEIIKFEDL